MVKCGVLFEVRDESLNIIQTIFGFKGLTCVSFKICAHFNNIYILAYNVVICNL
jgi:hypothetical protein